MRTDAGPSKVLETEARTAHRLAEADDEALGRAVRTGIVAGVGVLYVVVVVIGLLGGATFAESLLMAVWPALFAGPFFGGVVVVGRHLAHTERSGDVQPLPARPAAPGELHRRAA